VDDDDLRELKRLLCGKLAQPDPTGEGFTTTSEQLTLNELQQMSAWESPGVNNPSSLFWVSLSGRRVKGNDDGTWPREVIVTFAAERFQVPLACVTQEQYDEAEQNLRRAGMRF